jgi:YgiT-type zinc finger domain-containing protein
VTATFDLPNGGASVFRGVPALVCEACGERYFDERPTEGLLAQAKQTRDWNGEVEVRPYAA